MKSTRKIQNIRCLTYGVPRSGSSVSFQTLKASSARSAHGSGPTRRSWFKIKARVSDSRGVWEVVLLGGGGLVFALAAISSTLASALVNSLFIAAWEEEDYSKLNSE